MASQRKHVFLFIVSITGVEITLSYSTLQIESLLESGEVVVGKVVPSLLAIISLPLHRGGVTTIARLVCLTGVAIGIEKGLRKQRT